MINKKISGSHDKLLLKIIIGTPHHYNKILMNIIIIYIKIYIIIFIYNIYIYIEI